MKYNEEEHFGFWCEELYKLGIIKRYIHQPRSFVVYDSCTASFSKQLKTKEKIVDVPLLPRIVYTADYKIVFYKDCGLPLFEINGYLDKLDPRDAIFKYTTLDKDFDPIVYVEVKPPSRAAQFSGKLGSIREFPIKQRVLLENKNIFINKVVPFGMKSAFFGQTFTPKKYYYTDSGEKIRVRSADNYEKRRVREFLKQYK